MSAARRVALAFAVMVPVSCAGADPPPPPAPVAAPAAAPPARLGLLDPAPVEAPPSSPPAAPTPYAGAFATVPLPPGTPAIMSVVGRAADDVWMVAANSEVLHWDGAHVRDEGRPRCQADQCCGLLIDCAKQPKRCAPDCRGMECASSVEFGSVYLDRGEIVVRANICLGGLTCAVVESRRGKDGRWSCEQREHDGTIPVAVWQVSPSLRLETPARVNGGVQGETSVVSSERRVPLPEGVERGDVGLAAGADDDLWLWDRASPRLWHGNGLTWTPLATGLGELTDVWLAEGALWVVGDGVLLRRDLGRDTWDRFAAPGTVRVLRSAAPGFWLIGNDGYYRWNGRVLARIDTPLALEDTSEHVWLGSAGDLWVVGASPSAKVKGDVPVGVAFRLPPPEKRP